MSSRSRQVEASDRTRELGIMVRRIIAAILDLIPVVALFLLLSFVSGEFRRDDGDVKINLSGAWLYLFVVLAIEYFVVFEAKLGATLGKMFVGLKVVGYDGQKPSWGAALLRNALRPIDLLPIAYGVGLVVIFVTGKRQRLGDIAAATLVVEVENK